MNTAQKRLLIVFLSAGFLSTVLTAVLLPVPAANLFRLRVVGFSDWLAATEVSLPQRATAAVGGVIATLTVARLIWFPAASALPAVRGATLFVLGGVCLSLAAINLLSKPLLGLLPHWPHRMRTLLLLSVMGGIGLMGVLAAYHHFRKNRCARFSTPGVISTAFGAGTAYGCFSALWHCCPPIWAWRPYDFAGTIIGMICILTIITTLGLRWKSPVGEIIGGALLAMLYPWHTLFWAIKMFFAGAFFIWMARRTESAFTPAMAVSIALAVHVTLPFMGWTGVAISGAFLACSLYLGHRYVPKLSLGLP